MKYVIPLILILLVSSCQQKVTEQNVQLDELLMDVQYLNDTILSIDTLVVFGTSRSIKNNLKLIHKLADTINVKTASIIAEVYEERNKVFFVEENYKNFTGEVAISEQQLNKLKQDLNNGLLTTEKFNTFYQAEKSIILNLNQKISKSYSEAKRVVSFIQEEEVQIDSLINYLKEEKGLNQ